MSTGLATKFIPSPRLNADLGLLAAAVLRREGPELEQAARARAPVDTGTLADSIEWVLEFENGVPTLLVVANTEYAAFVEFGTEDTPMVPFLRQALHQEVRG